jgi:hypothetical protein
MKKVLNTVRFELLVERPLSKELRAVVATGKRSKPALQLQNPVVTLDGDNQGEIRSRRANYEPDVSHILPICLTYAILFLVSWCRVG